jgi:hypothetical protein
VPAAERRARTGLAPHRLHGLLGALPASQLLLVARPGGVGLEPLELLDGAGERLERLVEPDHGVPGELLGRGGHVVDPDAETYGLHRLVGGAPVRR